MTSFPPVTDTFARFVAETDFSTISDKVLDHAKHHILDTLGVALAALPTPVARIAIDYCQRAGVQETNSKIRVIVDETIPESSTYCPVGIHLKDGTRFTYTTAIAKGHPKNPMSESEVLDKFRSNAEAMLTVPSLEALISTAQRLESLINVR